MTAKSISSPSDGSPVLAAELTETREDLRRADAKARDLLVFAGLVVTVTGAVCGALHQFPPAPSVTGLLIALVPWTISVVQLLLVIRPSMSIGRVGRFADPGNGTRVCDLPIDEWQRLRWELLAGLLRHKHRRIRSAVDLSLLYVSLLIADGVLWALFGTRG